MILDEFFKSKSTAVLAEGHGNYAGDRPVNLGGVSMKKIQIGDTVRYIDQKAQVVDMSQDREHARITIPSSSTTKTVLTSDLRSLGRGMAEDNLHGGGPDDEVKFFIDSEPAYYAVMDRFGDHIDFRGDDMVAPQRLWGAIQQTAGDAGGAADIAGLEDDRMGTNDELDEQGVAENYPKHQDLSGISTDKLKAYVAKQSQQQNPGEGNQVRRVRAELERRSQGMSEDAKKKTPGVALSKAYKKDFDGKKPAQDRKETALTGTYSKTGKPGGPLVKKQGVAEGAMDDKIAKHNAAVAKMTKRTFAKLDYSHPDLLKKAPKGYAFGITHKLVPYEKDVSEAYNFKGSFPFDVDHMGGTRGINLPSAPTKKFFTDKKQWTQTVDDINSSKYDDNSDYIGVTGRSTVEINGHEWARWSDAQQKGYIKLSSMSEQGVAEGQLDEFGGGGFPKTPKYKVGDSVMVKGYQGVGKIAYIKHRNDVGVIIKEPSPLRVVTTIDELIPKQGVAESGYDSGDYSNDRQSDDYGRDLVPTGSGGSRFVNHGAHDHTRGRPAKTHGFSKNLPADPFGRTAGKIPHSARPKQELDPFRELDELSPATLDSYKTKAGAAATAADSAGDVKTGDRRFSGIVKATKKQFDQDAKQSAQKVHESRLRVMASIIKGQ